MHRLVLLLALAACAPPTPVRWNYGETWGGLCSTGKQQSPVDLHKSEGFAPRVQMEYWPTSTRLDNDGHTLEVWYEPGSFVSLDGQRYALKALRFHNPSEHLLDGKSFPMELQLVHQNEQGKLMMVAVFIQEGAANKWLQPAFGDLPYPGEHREISAKINAADLLPKSKRWLYYTGSMTHPPCTEGVPWFVFESPIELSAEQLAAFTRMFKDNHRPPVGRRDAIEGEAR